MFIIWGPLCIELMFDLMLSTPSWKMYWKKESREFKLIAYLGRFYVGFCLEWLLED